MSLLRVLFNEPFLNLLASTVSQLSTSEMPTMGMERAHNQSIAARHAAKNAAWLLQANSQILCHVICVPARANSSMLVKLMALCLQFMKDFNKKHLLSGTADGTGQN